MRGKPVKTHKHVRAAVFAFIIVTVLALGTFYYVWQTNVSAGKSYAGTQAYGELLYKRQQMQQMQEQQKQGPTNEAWITMRAPCCNYLEHIQRGSQLKVDVPSGSCFYDDLTQELITKGGYVLVDIEGRECEKRIAG